MKQKNSSRNLNQKKKKKYIFRDDVRVDDIFVFLSSCVRDWAIVQGKLLQLLNDCIVRHLFSFDRRVQRRRAFTNLRGH